MDYVRLGRSGLKVSRLILGCMSFGVPERGPHPWTLDEAASRPLIRRAVEAGINVFDTANYYSDGTSEEIVGRSLRDYTRRDETVIATKLFFPLRDAPNVGGLSRKAIFAAIDASLARLGTDYVDLYQIHRFDPDTPIEETLAALDDVVKSGRVRYLGASSMAAWQFATMLHTADRHGWTRFASMQNHLNLLYREEEREMLPLCRAEGVGVIPWSPLARGRLTRPWDETSARSESDQVSRQLYAASKDADRRVVEAVGRIAAARDLPPARIALAWLLRQPGITAPIIGATKPHHLEDAIAALDVSLTDDEAATLEADYVPHAAGNF